MKTWAEMTDEEQGELLLAHHRGEVIEIWDSRYDMWRGMDHVPSWVNWCKYRVKKEPVVELRRVLVVECDYGETVDAQCAYTDGKLTKIHWEADQ